MHFNIEKKEKKYIVYKNYKFIIEKNSVNVLKDNKIINKLKLKPNIFEVIDKKYILFNYKWIYDIEKNEKLACQTSNNLIHKGYNCINGHLFYSDFDLAFKSKENLICNYICKQNIIAINKCKKNLNFFVIILNNRSYLIQVSQLNLFKRQSLKSINKLFKQDEIFKKKIENLHKMSLLELNI